MDKPVQPKQGKSDQKNVQSGSPKNGNNQAEGLNYPISFFYEDDIREKRRQQQLQMAGKGANDRIGLKQIPNPVKYLFPDATLEQYRALIGSPVATTKEVDICSLCFVSLSKYHSASGQNTHLILDFLNPPPKGTRKLYPDIILSKVAKKKRIVKDRKVFDGDISDESSGDKTTLQKKHKRTGSDVIPVDFSIGSPMFSPKFKQDDWAKSLHDQARAAPKSNQVLLRLLPSDNATGINSSKKDSTDEMKTPTMSRQYNSVRRSPSSSMNLDPLLRKDSQMSVDRYGGNQMLNITDSELDRTPNLHARTISVSKPDSDGKNFIAEQSRRSSLFYGQPQSRHNLEMTAKLHDLDRIDSETRTNPGSVKASLISAPRKAAREELLKISSKRDRLRSMLASHALPSLPRKSDAGLASSDKFYTNRSQMPVEPVLKRRPKKNCFLLSACSAADRDKSIDKLYGIK